MLEIENACRLLYEDRRAVVCCVFEFTSLSGLSFFIITATGGESNPFSYQQEQGWLQAGDNPIHLPHRQPTELDSQKDQREAIALGSLGAERHRLPPGTPSHFA